MGYEQQNRDGRYYTRLYNTPKVREGLYELVKELCERNDFRYLIQAKNRYTSSDLTLTKYNSGTKNLGELLEQHYQKGCRNIEVAFTTENSVAAGPFKWYGSIPNSKEEGRGICSKLDIHFGRFRINAYTNDGDIAKKLGSLNGIITHNDPDVEIDMRNIWVKLGLYLLEKTGKSVGFLRSAKRMS